MPVRLRSACDRAPLPRSGAGPLAGVDQRRSLQVSAALGVLRASATPRPEAFDSEPGRGSDDQLLEKQLKDPKSENPRPVKKIRASVRKISATCANFTRSTFELDVEGVPALLRHACWREGQDVALAKFLEHGKERRFELRIVACIHDPSSGHVS